MWIVLITSDIIPRIDCEEYVFFTNIAHIKFKKILLRTIEQYKLVFIKSRPYNIFYIFCLLDTKINMNVSLNL